MLDITIYHLTDAVPTALFGIFALWAASTKRHWFVRTAVVGGALLTLLLVPAYEVVVIFGCNVLFMVVALAIWRKLRQRTSQEGAVMEAPARRLPRVSMATILLVTVVVAVVTAVAARVPQLSFTVWLWVLGVGLMGGVVGICCVWIVCGRSRWWVRLLATPLLLAGGTLLMLLLERLPSFAWEWVQGTYRPFDHYWQALSKSAGWSIAYWSRTTGIGMAILVAWLFVVRRAGWFDPFGETPGDLDETKCIDRGRTVARVAAVVLFLLVTALSVAILFRLAWPPPIPALALPEPNGWDDLMAAGEMYGRADSAKPRVWPPERPRLDLAYHAEAIALLRRGLEREIVNPYMYRDWPDEETRKFAQLHTSVSADAAAAAWSGDLDRQLDVYWDLLRLTDVQGRLVSKPGRINPGPFQWESTVLGYFWPVRTRLSPEQCRELLRKLVDYDRRRDRYEDKCARQRVVDANADWETRLRVLQADWAGDDPYWQGYGVFAPVIQLRLLIADLAIRAHQMQHGKLPATIDELVPEFLPAIPQDSPGSGRLMYRKMEDGYRIYFTGFDGDDDGGRTWSDDNSDGDLTPELYFP